MKKSGYMKIRFCGEQAARDGLQYFWIGTCCIDRSNSIELSEAINSVFKYFHHAARCYVFLSDVLVHKIEDEASQWERQLKESRWFTRAWSLQELIAPTSVEFFSREGQWLGDKKSLEKTLHEITGIAIEAYRGAPLSQFSMAERMSWVENRGVPREEDHAYPLLGLLDVYLPLNYGEGVRKAFLRLWDEVFKRHEDYTVLLRAGLWNPLAPHDSLVTKSKNISENFEWSGLKFHSPLDLASAATLAGHLPPIDKIPQRPQITVYGLRMSLFAKAVGSDLIAWTYYTQEKNGRMYAVCVRVIPMSPEKPAETQHLRGAG